MYDDPRQMEPLLPLTDRRELDEHAAALLARSANLAGKLHPIPRAAVAELLLYMNSYYSNLIEGQATHPREIEQAVRGELSPERKRRELQLLARAHVEVQRLLEARLAQEPALRVTSVELLRWLHRELYGRMPKELRVVRDAKGLEHPVEPGELRTLDVDVGAHVAPAHGAIPELLARFEKVFDPAQLSPLDRVIAAAASHHRLAWIHPFLDGNGRVTRLFTQAYLIRVGLDGGGLWSISRGLARNRDGYYDALAGADSPRRGDLDGRGNLSERGLRSFCSFFLDVSLDQVDFMAERLELDELLPRISRWVERRAASGELRPEAAHVLTDALLRGEISRGDVPRLAGLKERTARLLIGELLRARLLTSPSPKGPLRLGFPLEAAELWLPRLFPESPL